MILRKSLALLGPASRISIALTLLSVCLLFSADMLGFAPDESAKELAIRQGLAESLALQLTVMHPERDIHRIRRLVELIARRNSEILSNGVRRRSGQLIFSTPNHEQMWQDSAAQGSTSTHVRVPLFLNSETWGTVELRFSPLKDDSLAGFLQSRLFGLALYVGIIGFFVYLAFMLRTLRQIDPSAVVPDRVNAAFDTLSEGVMIIDEAEEILLANEALSESLGRDRLSLLGRKASSLEWKRVSRQKSGSRLPWLDVLESGKPSIGAQYEVDSVDGRTIRYTINASPIPGPDGKTQGVLVTLDDITELEQRNVALQSTVRRLKKTQARVEQQNKELTYLATRDALTGCLNRRALADRFGQAFAEARRYDADLCCIMVDLDHFKLVNDNFGHAVGDEVIKLLAEVLKNNIRDDDFVGRYGGEEFCVVLPGMDIDQAVKVAERIRLRVKDESSRRYPEGPRVTASLGVASIRDNPKDHGDLNNYADEALYSAKDSGRNRVGRYDSMSAETRAPTATAAAPPEVSDLQSRIDELEDIATKFSAELEYQRSYDELTGLPNHVLFYDRIQQVIERGARHDQLSALMILDIEKFSQINNSLGRKAGDQLLQQLATRLRSIVRGSDGLTRLSVSRFAGDEFALLLTDIPAKEQFTWVVKRIIDIVNQPVEIDGSTIYLGCHVGVSLYPTDAQSVEELLNNAMNAKQHAKRHKSEVGFQFFDRGVHEMSIRHLDLEADIRRAIEREEFVLMYQPKYDVRTRAVVGAEALIRWQHPERGLLPPFEFIEFAEQRDLILPIGDWTLREVCRQLCDWRDNGHHDCTIAINMSSRQLRAPDIHEKILRTLEAHEVPPRMLEIEITETLLMENLPQTIETLSRLHARGIKIAIDDFGTGYSSLSYLKSLPVDRLKIDRAFVRDLMHDGNDQKIVKTLVTMAHSMGMKVTAEGVETIEQYQLLAQFGADEIQGFLLSKPVFPDALQRLIDNPKKAAAGDVAAG